MPANLSAPSVGQSRPESNHFLLLTQYFFPEIGAPQIRLLAMAKEIVRRGHRVTVVTGMPCYPEGRVATAYRKRWFLREDVEGIQVIRTWIYPASGRSIAKRLLNYWSFTVSSTVGCAVAARPDYLFVESPPLFLGLTGLLFAKLRQSILLLNVSDLWPASAKDLGVISSPVAIWAGEQLERFLYRSASRVVTVTESIRRQVSLICGSKDKVLFLPNGVDLEVFSPSIAAGDHPLCDLVPESPFVYAGTVGYAQGLDVMIGAARVLADTGSKAFFLIVGEGPDKRRLEKMVESYRLQNVRFAPAQPVRLMPQILSAAAASIVCLRDTPVLRGARPSKIFPSLACATPVVFSGAGEGAALITENRCGLVVPAGDPRALAAAVRTLELDTELRYSLGRAGRRFVEQKYSWHRLVEMWLSELPSVRTVHTTKVAAGRAVLWRSRDSASSGPVKRKWTRR